jgi:uncharacterized membrane protein (DUF2068 family)
MDWSLWGCTRHGHATYAPDEPVLAQRLQTETPVGEAWRCLRCGDFVPGPPQGSGPASDAPVVLRGRALREATILRIFAVERVIRFLIIGALGFLVLHLRTHEASLRSGFEQLLPAARPLANFVGYNLDSSSIVRQIEHILTANPNTLIWIAAGLFAYAALELAEAIGLWSLKRWGEYLAVIATGAFLPLEIYELSHKITWLKLVAFAINVALVVYLVLSKRLFGVRGGAAAYRADRQSMSLLEVEETAAEGTASSTAPA